VHGAHHLAAAGLLFVCSAFAQTNSVSPTDQRPASPASPCQQSESYAGNFILSDTMGVDVGPYLDSVAHNVRQNWHKLIPEAGAFKSGYATIDFTINRDGSVTGMRLVSTSDDVDMDRAASKAISVTPFPSLPSELNKLELRFTFAYNPKATDQKRSSQFEITPSGHVRVAPGTSEQFAVVGSKTGTLIWSLGGPACDQRDCGAISTTGLYTAPGKVPDSPDITVTAAQNSAPFKSVCARITIVPPSFQK